MPLVDLVTRPAQGATLDCNSYPDAMEVRPVDPRDTERSEDSPVYRVYFWERMSAPGIPDERMGYKSDEYELLDATDVREVLDWAEKHAGPNRTFTVYVRLDRCEIKLFGRGPTQHQEA